MQLEYYFGDYNYPHDTYLQYEAADEEGFVFIDLILGFYKMKYEWRATYEDVLEAEKYSNVFEINPSGTKLRKKKQILNA